MTAIELTNFITNNHCEFCNKEFYEGDPVYSLQETNNTSLSCYFCNHSCIDYSIEHYPFLKQYTPVKTKAIINTSYYSNILAFMLCNIFYTKIIIYDCYFSNLKTLQYIHNIRYKQNKSDWEKQFIKDCLRFNLLKIEKII